MTLTYVVNVPVTDVWDSVLAERKKERLTQGLMGDSVIVLREEGPWVLGQVADGYQGFVRRADLVSVTTACSHKWATVVKAKADIRLIDSPTLSSGKVYLGTRLKLEEGYNLTDSEYTVCLPDGRKGRIASDAVALKSAVQDNLELAPSALGYALLLLGAPYLWGGITCSGVDCSGLVYIAYRSAGLLLPRDADQQYEYLWPVEGQPSPGDLVFFATEKPGLASHVGLYLGQKRFLHASSRLGGVVVTSLNSPFYRERFLGWRQATMVPNPY